MTDAQLYLAIGVPVISNALMLTLGLTLLDRLFTERLKRVEDVVDARLKNIETRLEHLEESR